MSQSSNVTCLAEGDAGQTACRALIEKIIDEYNFGGVVVYT